MEFNAIKTIFKCLQVWPVRRHCGCCCSFDYSLGLCAFLFSFKHFSPYVLAHDMSFSIFFVSFACPYLKEKPNCLHRIVQNAKKDAIAIAKSKNIGLQMCGHFHE